MSRDMVLADLKARALADSRDRPTWLAARSRSIGGSDAAKFAKVGSAPLYLRGKLDDPFTGNRYTVHGNDREPHMLAAYALEQNTTLYRSALNPRHVATPDGIKVGADGRIVLAQCKTANKPLGNVPPTYLRQMWWEQYVIGADRTLLIWEHHAGFQPVAMEPESVWVDRDDGKIADLIEIANIVLDGMDVAEAFRKELSE